MAAFKSLLLLTEIVKAGRRRKCYHNPKHTIVKNEICLEVKGNMARKGYCVACAREMVARARKRLEEMESALKG